MMTWYITAHYSTLLHGTAHDWHYHITAYHCMLLHITAHYLLLHITAQYLLLHITAYYCTFLHMIFLLPHRPTATHWSCCVWHCVCLRGCVWGVWVCVCVSTWPLRREGSWLQLARCKQCLQHTATHSATLQHTLQRSATHTATLCNTPDP